MQKIHLFTQADSQPPKAHKEPPKPKTKYHLTNWPEYNKALIQRGFVTLWLDQNTLDQWYCKEPRIAGGVFQYSEQCIQAALALKSVFRLLIGKTRV